MKILRAAPRIAGFQRFNNAGPPGPGTATRVGPIRSTKACRGPLRLVVAREAILIKRLRRGQKLRLAIFAAIRRVSSVLEIKYGYWGFSAEVSRRLEAFAVHPGRFRGHRLL